VRWRRPGGQLKKNQAPLNLKTDAERTSPASALTFLYDLQTFCESDCAISLELFALLAGARSCRQWAANALEGFICVILHGCSGAGTHGNGVPTPFSRFRLNELEAVVKWLFLGCVPTSFLLVLRPWLYFHM